MLFIIEGLDPSVMLRTILSQGLRRRRGIRYSLGEWSDPIRSWCARDTLLERFISKPKHFIQLQAGFCTSLENAFRDRMEPAVCPFNSCLQRMLILDHL